MFINISGSFIAFEQELKITSYIWHKNSSFARLKWWLIKYSKWQKNGPHPNNVSQILTAESKTIAKVKMKVHCSRYPNAAGSQTIQPSHWIHMKMTYFYSFVFCFKNFCNSNLQFFLSTISRFYLTWLTSLSAPYSPFTCDDFYNTDQYWCYGEACWH